MTKRYRGFMVLILLLAIILRTIAYNASFDGETEESRNITRVIQRLLQKTANKMIRPYPSGKAAVTVEVDVTIISIGDFKEAEMQFTAEMYLHQEWHDPRLAYSPNETNVLFITLNGDLARRFWQPDTFLENEVDGRLHTLLNDNMFYRIHMNGRILVSTRMTVSFSCPMDFKKFPMDEQRCGIYLGSYGYTTNDIVYEWHNEHEVWTSRHEIPRFMLVNITPLNITRKYTTGDFSVVGIEMIFKRRLSHYFTKVYIPSVLIVILSWLSFYVDRHSTPARVSLGITTVLTMTTISIGFGQESLPAVAYFKALDWFLFVSYFMVFAAFGEFAVINYRETSYMVSKTTSCGHNGVVPSQKANTSINGLRSYSNEMAQDHLKYLQECEVSTPRPAKKTSGFIDWFTLKFLTPPEMIDSWAKILFPTTYLIFNVVYWLYYLVIIDM